MRTPRIILFSSLLLAASALTILVATFVGARSGYSTQNSPSEGPPLRATPPVPIDLGDIEYIPVYPDAEIVKAEEAAVEILERRLAYHTAADFRVLKEFYEEELPKRGWTFSYGSDPWGEGNYTWTDPAGALPWHLYLDLSFRPLGGIIIEGENQTAVNIIYGRYPDVGAAFPLYRDAKAVELERSEKPGEPGRGDIPVRITDMSYVTDADPTEIADYYNKTLPEFGWQYFDFENLEYTPAQVGDITSEGLFFIGHRPGSSARHFVEIDLVITATKQQDGQTRTQVRVEEIERLILPDSDPEVRQ